MAYPRGRRTPLKRRATYGRGTRTFARAKFRRAYFNRRRGVGRKEKKGCDVSFTTNGVISTTNTNGGIYLLNGIQEGVGSWNRIGRYMYNKSIELDLTLRYTSSYGALDTDITSGEWVRAVLVWDKQPNNGTIPTFDTIFGQTSQAGVESASVMDHLRYDNMFRFKVLMDECINPTLTNAAVSTPINPASASLVNNTYFRFHKYVKLRNMPTNFSGTANPMTTANISTGALYLILRTQSATLTELWAIEDTSTARLRYVD